MYEFISDILLQNRNNCHDFIFYSKLIKEVLKAEG